MYEGLRVVVVVPAFNEERHIDEVLGGVPRCVDEVLVVDDASLDGTVRRVLAASAGDARVRLLRHAVNRGVGAAIATGYRAAQELCASQPAAFVVMAGDGQMDPGDMPSLLAPLASGRADYVKGERFSTPSIRAMPRGRYLGGRVFSALTALATALPITDSQCGYTALSSEACARLDLAGLWAGFGYPNDLLGQLAARGLRVAEVPVRAVYGGERSKLRLRDLPPIVYLVGRAWARRVRSSP